MTVLHDPERCPRCDAKGRVIGKERGQTKAGVVYWRRRHQCRTCVDKLTGKRVRWSSTQSLVNLRLIRIRQARS
jgi:hypothetical protein